MKKILAGVLVAFSLVFGGCQSSGTKMAPIQIQPVVTEAVATKIATAVVETTIATPTSTVTPTATPIATAEITIAKQTGSAGAEGKAPAPEAQPEVQPWDKPDWGWVRATWAAQGKHDFLTGEIGTCQKLAAVLKTCFFTTDEQSQRPVEFGYDGKRTYFLAYEVGDVHTDIRELGVESRIWLVVNGDLLFPLCGTGKVEVYKFDPATGSRSIWC